MILKYLAHQRRQSVPAEAPYPVYLVTQTPRFECQQCLWVVADIKFVARLNTREY